MHNPRFILRSSYGNDSIALIQWAHEQQIEGVTVLYSDTGWARRHWAAERVPKAEAWVRSLGFTPDRTVSPGMRAIVMAHKGWPFRLGQFCTDELKITPSQKWLAEHDPEKRAIILTGVRRDESPNRKDAPHYRLNSFNDGGRCMVAPLVEFSEAQRDELIIRAGWEVLDYRSEECKCINRGKEGIKRFDEDDLSEIESVEAEAGYTAKGKPRTMYRPNKHGGAVGIREVHKWANSPRGKYVPPGRTEPLPEPETYEDEELIASADERACQREGYCE